MAYGARYGTSYKRLSGNIRYIWIYEKDYSGGVTTFVADGEPLVIELDGDVTDLYCGTAGSGATINLRVTPLQLLNLFTTDPQKYMVKCIDQSGNVHWQGFINTGIYFEDLNNGTKTLLSLKANDGMAVLDMMPYRPTPTTYYEGVVPIATVLNNIFSKLNLTFNEKWGLIDLRVANFQDNVFLYLEANQNNYIDENGVPMSCRQVLDTIMKSFGLRMTFRGDKIFIVDPIILHNINKGQIFNAGWGEVVQAFPGGTMDISLNQIRWYQTGVSMDVIPPINQLEISYDPYSFTGTSLDLSDLGSWSNAGTWTGPLDTTPNEYYINRTVTYKNVTCDGSILMQAIKRKDGTDTEYYFKLQKGSGALGYAGIGKIDFPLTSLYKDSNLKLKISADFYCNTRDNDNIYNAEITPTEENYIDVSLGYSIGGGAVKWFNNRIQSDYTISNAEISKSRIEDGWFTNDYHWPYGTLCDINTDGSLSVYISGKYDTRFYGNDKNVLLKNIKVEVVNSNGDPINNNSIKYTALKSVPDNYIKEGTTINLLHGTGPYGVSKGAYRDYNTKLPSLGIYRGLDDGTGTLYPNSYHVAQSYVSQYKSPRLVINGALNVSNHLLETQNYLIKWSNYFPNKAFYIACGTYYDKREYMNVRMVEIESTRENIS